MDFNISDFYKFIDGARFTHHGFYCKHCGDELYVLNLGNGFCAIRCRNNPGFHIVRADSVFDAERFYGVKRFGVDDAACMNVEDFR